MRAGTVPSSRADGTPVERLGLAHGADDGLGHRLGGQGADDRDVRLALPASGGEREHRVAIAGRVRRGDRAREAIVGHQRHAIDVGLGQPGVGGDEADRRVLAGARRPRAWPSSPLRSSLRTSASDLPSAVRTPATTWPVDGSMMSPTALTATMAATTRPFGQRDRRRAEAAFHRSPGRPSCRPWRRRRRRRCLPRPGRRWPLRAPCSRSRRSAGSSGCLPNRRSNRIAAGTIGTTPVADLPADVVLFEIAHHALRRVEAEGAAAGEHDRVDLVDHVERIEQVRFARARRAAALRDAARRAFAVDEDHRAAGRPLR